MNVRFSPDWKPSFSKGRFNILQVSTLQQMDGNSISIHVDEIGNIDIWEFGIVYKSDGYANLTVRDCLFPNRDIHIVGVSK